MGNKQGRAKLTALEGRFEEESLMAAIAANKRQRKLLVQQARRAAKASARPKQARLDSNGGTSSITSSSTDDVMDPVVMSLTPSLRHKSLILDPPPPPPPPLAPLLAQLPTARLRRAAKQTRALTKDRITSRGKMHKEPGEIRNQQKGHMFSYKEFSDGARATYADRSFVEENSHYSSQFLESDCGQLCCEKSYQNLFEYRAAQAPDVYAEKTFDNLEPSLLPKGVGTLDDGALNQQTPFRQNIYLPRARQAANILGANDTQAIDTIESYEYSPLYPSNSSSNSLDTVTNEKDKPQSGKKLAPTGAPLLETRLQSRQRNAHYSTHVNGNGLARQQRASQLLEPIGVNGNHPRFQKADYDLTYKIDFKHLRPWQRNNQLENIPPIRENSSIASRNEQRHFRHSNFAIPSQSIGSGSQNQIEINPNLPANDQSISSSSEEIQFSSGSWQDMNEKMSSNKSRVPEIDSRLQRGLAFNFEQRKQLNLLGHLPAAIQDQDLQAEAILNHIEQCKDELSNYIYLRNLKDYNEKLFYYTLTKYVDKLMPLVYTPTVGLACQKFSEIFMRPRGLFVTLNDVGRVDEILSNWHSNDVRVIVVTDGGRILGLGDLGANGMGISIGKLSLYTALAGISPQNVLPVTLDVGTDNQKNLEDPFYIGLRHTREAGQQFDRLVEEFMRSVANRWGPSCLVQFEDFQNATAFKLLERYRNEYCCFNDDIQGTASVCLSGLLSAAKLIKKPLSACSYVFYGAGEANLGTAHLLVMAMLEEGQVNSVADARKRIWLVDSKGLVVKSRQDLTEHKKLFAQSFDSQLKNLEDIVINLKPTAIIGASAQANAFNESICRRMAEFNERPIIFALSNPTSKAECTAQQAYDWTDGRCVFASGSPFDPVHHGGKTYVTGQGNNAYIFPGVGLASIAAQVHSIPEESFLIAAKALSEQLSPEDVQLGLVYPRLNRIRSVTLSIASKLVEFFYAKKLANRIPEPSDKTDFLKNIQSDFRYSADLEKELS